MKDMETWESSGQWMFSCYSPSKEKPNISGRTFPSVGIMFLFYCQILRCI